MFDGKDKLLLRELLKDGRQPITELAKKCGVTRQSVYARIKELKKKGIKFTIDIDPDVLDLKIKAYILIIAEPQTEFRKETDKIIKTFREISQIHYLLGRFDIIVEVIVRNIDELRDLLRRIQRLPAVKKTETLMVYETTKFDPKDPIRKLVE